MSFLKELQQKTEKALSGMFASESVQVEILKIKHNCLEEAEKGKSHYTHRFYLGFGYQEKELVLDYFKREGFQIKAIESSCEAYYTTPIYYFIWTKKED